MKTLTCGPPVLSPSLSVPTPPPAKVWRKSVWLTRIPGASAAKLMKLRLFWGRFSICSCDTLVPISDVRVSTSRRPTTTIAARSPGGGAVDAAALVSASSDAVCPTSTVTRWLDVAPPFAANRMS